MKKVLINVEERELRVAILEDEQLVELYIESLDEKTILNNIYKGRIEGILPGLKAAFVNIGLERNAFLHFDDVRPDLLWTRSGRPNPALAQPKATVIDVDMADESPAELAVDDVEVAVSDESAETEAPALTEAEQDEARRRRRRGRRGGRRKKRDGDLALADTPAAALADDFGEEDDEDDEDEDLEARGTAAPVRPFQEPGQEAGQGQQAEESAPGQHPQTSPGAGRSERQRRRRERWEQKKLERQQRRLQQPPQSKPFQSHGGAARPQHSGQQQPSAAASWVPPAIRGAHGTRAAANPYDVFSPYSQPQPPKRQWRRGGTAGGSGVDDFGNQRRGFAGRNPANDHRDSQEDFFGAPPRRREPEYPDDESQPITENAGANVIYDDFDEFEDAVEPAPGNEKFPVARQQRRPGGSDNNNARRKRRGGRNRTMKKRGPSNYAAKAKKGADTEEKPAAKKATKAVTKKAADKVAVVAKPRVSKTKVAEETTAPKKRAAKTSAPAAAPAKAVKVATVSPRTAKAPAAGRLKKPKATEPVEVVKREPKKAAAEKPISRSARKPEQPSQALGKAPVTEKPRRGRTRRAEPGSPESASAGQESFRPVPAEPNADTTVRTESQPSEPGSESRQFPEQGKRSRSRRRRGRGQGQDAGRRREAESTQVGETIAESDASFNVETVPQSQTVDQETTSSTAVQEPSDRKQRFRDRDRRPQEQGRQDRKWQRPPLFTEVFKKGDEIMVQVIKEEIGMKGARISTYVSLPGRYLVLLPYPNEEGGISRKVEDIGERKRLKRILREISSDETAFIIRTAGVYREETEIRSDVDFLTHEWRSIAERHSNVEATSLVYDDHDILYRLARDVFDDNVSEILIDSHGESEKLKSILSKLIPSLVDKVKLYSGPENIFHKYQVEKQIQKAARRKVWLKSGGYLIIDEAEALTAIDVNTGKSVGKDDQEKLILKTNLEAARAVARELKLRDIGGLIVIDFIDMKDYRNREQVVNELKANLRRDRSKTSVSTISEFGLVEMTRKRVRRSLRKTLFMDCPYCQGAGVILNEQQIWLHIKHELVRQLEATKPSPSLNITVNPKIRAYIDQNYRDALRRLEQRYDAEIRVTMSDVFHVENYAIEKALAGSQSTVAAVSGGR